MLKKLKEIFKIIKDLKGCKSLVALRCSHCNSLDIELVPNTYITNATSDSIKKEQYGIVCNKCNSIALINEFWEDNSNKEDKNHEKAGVEKK